MAQNTVKKQRIPNSERRRTSIKSVLDSALTLFVTQGYDATSMDDIARQAGLTKGALYFYFKDKLSLLAALLERTDSELIDPIVNKISASTGPARDRIVMLTNWFARIGAERKELPLLHVLVSLEMHGRDNKVEKQVRETYARLQSAITDVTRQGQASGEFTPDVAPEYQAGVIVALIDGLLLEWHRRGEHLDGRALAHAARNMILNGIVTNRQPA